MNSFFINNNTHYLKTYISFFKGLLKLDKFFERSLNWFLFRKKYSLVTLSSGFEVISLLKMSTFAAKLVFGGLNFLLKHKKNPTKKFE